ncbi:MAG: phytoene desaturase family protein [Bacteroidota bacterium]|nr:phytoene desaturase family protein [Candidatus Kapabacteria bacterium]MDW8271380.1 phytoene desaturase family protein [Bacteroidota bacterium]
MSKAVVIVGAGLGGLSAAMHLRMKGFEVTVYEKNALVGGRANRIEDRGFRFDTGPSLVNYPWVFEELFSATGAQMRDYVELLPLDPSVVFYWRDGAHLTLSADFDRMARDLSKFEHAAHVQLARWLATTQERFRFTFAHLVTSNAETVFQWIRPVPKRGLVRLGITRSLDSELGRYFRSPYVRAALGSYAMYLGGSPYELPGTFSILPFGELYYGLWYPRGGIYALVEAIYRRAQELGVRVITNTPVRSIQVRDGRVTGIELSNETFVPCEIVVSNVDVPTTHRMLEGASIPRYRWTMTPGVITFYWGLKHKPGELHHHAIFLPADMRRAFDQLRTNIPEDLPFYTCLATATDPSLAPTGHHTMFVLVPTPTLSNARMISDWSAVVDSVRTRVFERLAHHGFSIAQSDIVVEHVWTPIEWKERFGLYDGSAFGLSHALRHIGPLRAPNRDPNIQGLYYVGASTTPGTGMPMVVLSGRMTAERISNDVRG